MKVFSVVVEKFQLLLSSDNTEEPFTYRCIGSCWGNRREGAHWGDLGVDGWIILG